MTRVRHDLVTVAGFATDGLDRRAGFNAPHYAHNLMLAVLALAHDDLPLRHTIVPKFQ